MKKKVIDLRKGDLVELSKDVTERILYIKSDPKDYRLINILTKSEIYVKYWWIEVNVLNEDEKKVCEDCGTDMIIVDENYIKCCNLNCNKGYFIK